MTLRALPPQRALLSAPPPTPPPPADVTGGTSYVTFLKDLRLFFLEVDASGIELWWLRNAAGCGGCWEGRAREGSPEGQRSCHIVNVILSVMVAARIAVLGFKFQECGRAEGIRGQSKVRSALRKSFPCAMQLR